jgi:transposase-like protein
MYQVSESAIYHAFHGLGTLARFQGQPGRELPARWHTYARRYQAGQSVARIAKEFGVSTSVVHHALRRMGVAMRPKRPPVKLTAEEVMQLLKVRDEEGLNGTELGTRFGISQEYACRILRGKARRDISRTEDLA